MADRKDKSLGSNFTGELMPFAVKRLHKEKHQLSRETKEMAEQGIYFHFDDARNHKAVAMVVGPDETPYVGGFYLFEFTFPNNYPFQPPHVKFLTGDGRVRFNPNLYVDGKVCLSILGTWEGQPWTASCSFRTTIFSIQSLLNSRPLQNEPGCEGEAGKDCELYSSMLRYENIAVAVMQLARLPDSLHPLRGTMASIFVRRMSGYLKVLDDFDAQDGKKDTSPLYGFTTCYAPGEVRKRLAKLRETLLEDPELKDALTEDLAAVSEDASKSRFGADETQMRSIARGIFADVLRAMGSCSRRYSVQRA